LSKLFHRGDLLESTVNFKYRSYAYTQIELVDKDELFPDASVYPAYRIGAYTLGECAIFFRVVCDSLAWEST